MAFISTKNNNLLLPSRYSPPPKDDIVSNGILTIVKNQPKISQKQIIDSVRRKLNPKPDPKTVIQKIKMLCQVGKLHNLHAETIRRTTAYVTADYDTDEIIHKQIKENIKKFHALLDEIEIESSRYKPQLMSDVNNMLEKMSYRIPELIKSYRDSLELQLKSWSPDICEQVRSTWKLLDKHPLGEQHQKLPKIIHEISTKLSELDSQRIKYVKIQQSASSAKKKNMIKKKIAKIDDRFDYLYSSLLEIQNRIKSKSLDDVYEDRVREHLEHEPSTINKIYEMLNEYPWELQFKMQNILRKIINDLYASIDEQNTLHSKFEKEQNKDMLDYIEEELDMNKNKEDKCKTMLDKIWHGMESDTTIKQILTDIPAEYVTESKNNTK